MSDKTARNHQRAQKEAELQERRAKVLQYVVAGATVRQIADKLGVSVGTVTADKKAALEELHEQEQMAAKEYRDLEARRLDAMFFALWPTAKEGIPGAVQLVMQIHERKARLFGYDAIPKIEVEVSRSMDVLLEKLEASLDAETFSRVLAVIAVDATG